MILYGHLGTLHSIHPRTAEPLISYVAHFVVMLPLFFLKSNSVMHTCLCSFARPTPLLDVQSLNGTLPIISFVTDPRWELFGMIRDKAIRRVSVTLA